METVLAIVGMGNGDHGANHAIPGVTRTRPTGTIPRDVRTCPVATRNPVSAPLGTPTR